MTKRTELDQIEINLTSGVIALRFAMYDEDGDRKWHRTSIEPGIDVEAQIAAVNVHLDLMKKKPVGAETIAKIKSVAAREHTPEVIARFNALRAEAANAVV